MKTVAEIREVIAERNARHAKTLAAFEVERDGFRSQASAVSAEIGKLKREHTTDQKHLALALGQAVLALDAGSDVSDG